MALVADSSAIVTVSSAVTADTDGDWVELFPSTSKEYKWMIVSLFNSVSGPNAQFDIGTGEPGFQVDDVLQDQFARWTVSANTGLSNMVFSFPMPIDLGTRLWIRIKDNNAVIRDYSCVVTLSILPLSTTLPTSSESFATQGGVSSPASFDVFGGWVTMFNPLGKKRSWLSLVLYTTNNVSVAARFDIGIGDPRTVSWGELHFQKRADTSYIAKGCVYNMPVDWTVGDHLSIRVKDSSSGVRTYDVGAVLF